MSAELGFVFFVHIVLLIHLEISLIKLHLIHLLLRILLLIHLLILSKLLLRLLIHIV